MCGEHKEAREVKVRWMHPSPLAAEVTPAQELAWIETNEGGSPKSLFQPLGPAFAPATMLTQKTPEPPGSRSASCLPHSERPRGGGEARGPVCWGGVQGQAGLRPAAGEAALPDPGRERAERLGQDRGGQRGAEPRAGSSEAGGAGVRGQGETRGRAQAQEAPGALPSGPIGERKRGKNHGISKQE